MFNEVLTQNQIAIAKAARLLDQTQFRSEISSDLMRRSDWRFRLNDVNAFPERNLCESWLMGKRNGTVPTLAPILDLAIEMARADFGNIQLFDPAERALRIVTSRGLGDEFLEYFAIVRISYSACAVAMQQNCQVVVSDVRNDPCFNAESRKIMLRAGALAVQSTPISSSSGRLLGMLSTHCRVPGKPPLASLSFLNRLARRTAKLLE